MCQQGYYLSATLCCTCRVMKYLPGYCDLFFIESPQKLAVAIHCFIIHVFVNTLMCVRVMHVHQQLSNTAYYQANSSSSPQLNQSHK